MNNLLRFSPMSGNAKLENNKNGYSFSLPSGYSCPGAKDCLGKAVEKDGKVFLEDGKHQKFRCFSAVSEARFPSVRKQRWNNFNILKKHKSVSEIVELLKQSLPKNADMIRVHVAGDFYSKNYLQAWMIIAELNPSIIFYAYTKSLHLLEDIFIPNNFKLNASYGGRYDSKIQEMNLKHVKVVYSEDEAKKLGYKLDHDDTLAYKQDDSFALLLHGSQAKGTSASKAIQLLKTKGIFGYSSSKKKNKSNEKQ